MKLSILLAEELSLARDIILVLVSSLIGFFSNAVIEVIKKRKNPREVESLVTSQISSAAKEAVETQHSVITMLDERLASERVYFEEQLEKYKKTFEESILEMQIKYEKELYAVKISGEQEKFKLSRQIDQLQKDKIHLQAQVSDLEARLSKYDGIEHK